jgi:hypothetical protein
MKSSRRFSLTLQLTTTFLILASSAIGDPNPKSALLALPLSFEANHGQTGSSVKFLSRGDGYALFLTQDSAVFKLRPSVKNKPPVLVRMKLAGAQPAQVFGAEALPGKVNYFIGADPAKWTSGVATYGKVEYKQVYKGIDLVYYGKQRQLEYDFTVAPGADPARIALEFSGAKPILGAGGDLQLTLDGAPLRFRKPVVYQIDGGKKKIVQGSYELAGGRVQFKLGHYNHSRALIIDPVLDYMTYLGGTGSDQIGWPGINCPQCTANPPQGIAVDQAGNVYVTGFTSSTDFPLQGAFQSQDLTTPAASHNPTAFVVEINPDASALVYSTYLGGSVWDEASAIAVDSSGSAYVTGYTFSKDFPVTLGAVQTRCGAAPGAAAGSIVSNCAPAGNSNAFLTKLSPGGGNLVYSTFLGGGTWTLARAVAVDSQGQAYIAGSSADSCSNGELPGNSLAHCFPETANALIPQSLYNGTVTPGRFNPASAFVAVFDAGGANLLYSTLYGDTNPANSPTSSWATFGMGVAVDPAGNFYLTGMTYNPEIPSTPGALQPTYSNFVSGNANTNHAFVAKFSPVTGVGTGASLIYGTYLGGAPPNASPGEQVAGIAADASGNAYVTGLTQSYTFPVTPGAADTNSCSQTSDCQNNGFLTKISPDGSGLVWSTLVGAIPVEQSFGRCTVSFIGPPRVDGDGNVYITGQAIQSNSYYPLVNAVQPPPNQQSGIFVTKYDPTGSTIYFSTVIYSPSYAAVLPSGVDVDSQGNIYVAGHTRAQDLPTTSGVFQPTFAGNADFVGIIARIDPFPNATIQLSVAPNSANAGTPVTFTATLTGVSAHPTPTGTVSFLNGATVLGRGTLDANGIATFSSTTLAAGAYSVTAVYLGGTVYSSVTSTPQALTIN